MALTGSSEDSSDDTPANRCSLSCGSKSIRVVPKIRGPFLGVPIIRTIMFWGLHWGLLILGNYHTYLLKARPVYESHLLRYVRGLIGPYSKDGAA